MRALPLHGLFRRSVVGLLATLLLLPIAAASGQTTGTAPGRGDDSVTLVGSQTADELAACLQERPNLAVALLIDATGSLASTDPSNERAPVLAGFLSRLEDINGAAFRDGSRQVFVSIAYFGTGVREHLAWSSIDTPQPVPAGPDGSTRSIAQMVLEDTPSRNTDSTTEFSDALTWAAARHREVPRLVDADSVCTMTLWFSDGELDPDNARRGTPYERPAVIAETETLCAPGGVLDVHRRTGAALVGILLVEELTESSAVTQLPRMHAMVEGSDPERRECGSEPSRGLFLQGDLNLLSLRFERAIVPGQGGVLQGTYRGDPVVFVVDPGVSRVRIVMSARSGFVLTTASGATVDVPEPSATPRTSNLPRGVQPDIRWASGAVSIDLEVGGDFGTWTVARRGPDGPVDVYYFSDLRFQVDRDEVRLRSGEPGSISGRIVDGAGNPVDLAVYFARQLSGAVDGAPLSSQVLMDDGTFRAEFPVDTEQARIPARLRLDLVTRGGTSLQPITVDLSLPVALPGWFPEVDVAPDFDSALMAGRGEAVLEITAIGSDLGPTRVCVRPGPLADGSEQLARLVRLEWDGLDLSRCVDLAAGEQRGARLLAQLAPGQGPVSERSIGFPLVVELQSAAVDGRPSVSVDYVERRSVVVRPAPPNPWIVFVLLALGLLIPLLVLHWLNVRAARFRTRNLQHARVPVTLDRSSGTWQVRRGSGGQLLEFEDFDYLPSEKLDGSKEWEVTSPDGASTGELWTAKAPRWPLGIVRAFVAAPPAARLISNETPTTTSDGRTAGIGLNPQGSAYLVVPDVELRAAAAPDVSQISATLVTVLGHEGMEMPTIVREHAHDLQTGLTGGDEVERLVSVVDAEDRRAAESRRSEAPPMVSDAAPEWSAATTGDPWDLGPDTTSGHRGAPGASGSAGGDVWPSADGPDSWGGGTGGADPWGDPPSAGPSGPPPRGPSGPPPSAPPDTGGGSRIAGWD